jgi:hypothetical protein
MPGCATSFYVENDGGQLLHHYGSQAAYDSHWADDNLSFGGERSEDECEDFSHEFVTGFV